MKDYTAEELEETRPDGEAKDLINFCLKRLYSDRKHSILNNVVDGMTYEELIGTLLKARDELATL